MNSTHRNSKANFIFKHMRNPNSGAAALLLGISVFLSACTTTENAKKLVGQWRGAAWTSNGVPVESQPIDVTFAFQEDGNYTYTNSGQKESGLYKIEGDNLYTTPAGQQAIMVKIVKLTADSLVFDMNRAGNSETMVLLRK
jgi:hypothetical protein